MSRAVLAALTVVQNWTRCYTATVPEPDRAARRAELAADVHDHLADLADRQVGGYRAALEILRRLVLGVPADLAWALQPDAPEENMKNRTRTLAVAGWATAFVLAILDFMGALAGLQNGWRELPQHWWSTLAVAGVLLTTLGLSVTLASVRRTAHRPS